MIAAPLQLIKSEYNCVIFNTEALVLDFVLIQDNTFPETSRGNTGKPRLITGK